MKRIRVLAVASLSFALVLGVLGVFESLPGSSVRSSIEMNAFAVVGSGKVQAQYEQWAARQDANGGAANIMITLGPDWDHTTAVRSATGAAKLDLVAGKISAAVKGLPSDSEWDVWLVDNAPEREDVRLFAGRLQPNGEYLELGVELGAELFRGFQADRVLVARAGADPAEGYAIAGSATLFQRLYTALESEEALWASDFAHRLELIEPDSGSALGTRSALADTIFVDADVLFDSLVADGAELFINEQFDGNGRTCATCHPSKNNTTIDVRSIAALDDDDALFVAEFVPALAENFEKPALMRGAALILENVDGMDDLANKFVMRGVPHTLGLSTSLQAPTIPFDNSAPDNSGFPPVSFDPFIPFPIERTGWGGDGAPNTGALRDFATGAVNQHFPKSLGRVDGVDFRLPSSTELDAMEAFQLALGRQSDPDLTSISFTNPRVTLGVEVFNRLDTGNPPGTPCFGTGPGCPPLPAGKCALCHSNAGANIDSAFFTALLMTPFPITGNANFGTGVNELSSGPADLIDPANNPRDGGFGIIPHDGTPLPQLGGVPCVPPTGGFGTVTLPGGALPPGLCEEDFNTPPLVEAADTAGFFHNNAVATLESAVAFYNDDAFNNSAGGQLAIGLDTNFIGIRIDATEVTAIASLLRVLNALENIRAAREQGTAAFDASRTISHDLIRQAISEGEDAVEVLDDARLHPVAVSELLAAIHDAERAIAAIFQSTRQSRLLAAAAHLDAAEADMINVP